MKKNILIIAYYFPPHSGAGVQRPLRLVNELVKDGWNVTVISSNYSYLAIDNSLSKKIPENINIMYLRDSVSEKIQQLGNVFLSKVYSFLAFPDRMVFWYLFNIKKIKNIVKENDFDVCLTTSFPFSAHFIGKKIKSIQPDIKWIIDYRDAWSKNPSIIYSKRKPLLYFLSHIFERYFNKLSDSIMTVSDNLKNDILHNDKNQISVIHNGYDCEDFKYLSKKNSLKYDIFYMGSLYAERDPKLFLVSFLKFLDTLTDAQKSMLKLTFIGDSRSEQIQKLRQLIPSSVELNIQNYIAHSEILNKAQSASLFLLLIDETIGAKGVVTGKLFEYLNLFAPILGIVPLDGDAAKIIRYTNSGSCFAPHDKEGITQFLIKDFSDWSHDKNRVQFLKSKNYKGIERFSSQSLYQEFMSKCVY